MNHASSLWFWFMNLIDNLRRVWLKRKHLPHVYMHDLQTHVASCWYSTFATNKIYFHFCCSFSGKQESFLMLSDVKRIQMDDHDIWHNFAWIQQHYCFIHVNMSNVFLFLHEHHIHYNYWTNNCVKSSRNYKNFKQHQHSGTLDENLPLIIFFSLVFFFFAFTVMVILEISFFIFLIHATQTYFLLFVTEETHHHTMEAQTDKICNDCWAEFESQTQANTTDFCESSL